MKIAFVRGPQLNPWELQTYDDLAKRHDFLAIGADWQFYQGALLTKHIRVRNAHAWGAGLARLHPKHFIFYNRSRSWILGESYGLCGLDTVAEKPDLYHSAEVYSTMTHECLTLARRHGAKVVVTVWENLPHRGELHPLRRARKRAALKQIHGFLAVTERSRKMLLAEGVPSERIDVIPMAVDLKRFVPSPRAEKWVERWRLRPAEKVVLFVGRWVEEKGILDLIDAIPYILEKSSSPLRFVFVGAGPLERDLQAAALRYPKRIELVPFVHYEELPEIHNMADVLVLPSKSALNWEEQFGYVLAESMACGKAIVTTESGSIPDVVGPAAILVQPGNPEALAEAVGDLLNHDSLARNLGQSARERALHQFNSESNGRRIEALYKRVLQGPL